MPLALGLLTGTYGLIIAELIFFFFFNKNYILSNSIHSMIKCDAVLCYTIPFDPISSYPALL